MTPTCAAKINQFKDRHETYDALMVLFALLTFLFMFIWMPIVLCTSLPNWTLCFLGLPLMAVIACPVLMLINICKCIKYCDEHKIPYMMIGCSINILDN